VRVVVTKRSLSRKIRAIWEQLPTLEKLIMVDIPEHESERVLSYPALMQAANDHFEAAHTAPDFPSIIHYTSGSTGKPKGVQHIHKSLLTQMHTFHEIFQYQPDDIYWCTADPAWVTGTTYGILAPWHAGITQVHYGGNYDASVWMTLLEREKVTLWYTAPTALRMLMQEEDALYKQFDLSNLKRVYSVGEPLNPEIVHWVRRVLGKEVYDTWFQTETGAIMIANRPGLAVKPGSMGKPVSGIEAAILDSDAAFQQTGQEGNLCLKAGWDSMFITYLNNEIVYNNRFREGYYYTNDLAYQDEEGYFWFIGRSDDIINTAGHLVSPFEVESALLELEEIIDVGVVGAQDELLFEKVVAFVRLKKDVTWSRDLELKVRLHVSNRVSAMASPHEIRVVDSIPKNKSGKIMRRVLRAWYSGKDAGDISTMED
jgi:acetyl-CoA synthetase